MSVTSGVASNGPQTVAVTLTVTLPATITWTNVNGGRWTEPANWDLGRVPSEFDSVVIEMGTPVSTATRVDFSIRALSLTGTRCWQRSIMRSRLLRMTGPAPPLRSRCTKLGIRFRMQSASWNS